MFRKKEKSIPSFEEKNKIKYNKNGYYVVNESELSKQADVAIITPVYNAELFLKKTIESVTSQEFDKKIQFILVDDGSTDSSREILIDYANRYKCIIPVFLKENTGSPAQPRNLGIELSNTTYITFLDADDWLHKNGLQVLYNILEETHDDYIVGKTIRVETKSTRIVAEHESYTERRSVSPFSIPHLFKHLGPIARMVRSTIIKENNITYPKMNFAEDKQFFIDVLLHCKSISTTTKVIYYINRLDDNDSSLTTQTNVMQKMDSNIKVINYVISKNLDIDKEKQILNRLYEFDSITRLFNRNHFLKGDNKEEYYAKFKEVLNTTENLSYDFTENFFHPINKVAYNLFIQERHDELIALFNWDKQDKVKNNYEIIDGMPYFNLPMIPEEDSLKYMRIPMLVVFRDGFFEDDYYVMKLKIYGDYIDEVNDVILRNREDVLQEYSFSVKIEDNGEATVKFNSHLLGTIPSSSYAIHLRYKGYNKTLIRRRKLDFYTTVNSNIGFKNS